MNSQSINMPENSTLTHGEAEIIKESVQEEGHTSPEKSRVEKKGSEFSLKTSQELLGEIYLILNENSRLKRFDSLKSISKVSETFKCKCKKTKCLKMYCECFAMGKMCNGCLCCDCQNIPEFEEERAIAIDEAFEKDSDIFQMGGIVKGGCICKKTGCIKKYCECFSLGKACTKECKCHNCCNSE